MKVQVCVEVLIYEKKKKKKKKNANNTLHSYLLLYRAFQHGMIFGPLTILPFLIFSGFFVQFRDAHPYLRWLFHLSFLKYGFEGVMIAIYG